jgi:hypothetical protein
MTNDSALPSNAQLNVLSIERVAEALEQVSSRSSRIDKLLTVGAASFIGAWIGLAYGGLIGQEMPNLGVVVFAVAATVAFISGPAVALANRKHAQLDAQCAQALGVSVDDFKISKQAYEPELAAYAASKARAAAELEELSTGTRDDSQSASRSETSSTSSATTRAASLRL